MEIHSELWVAGRMLFDWISLNPKVGCEQDGMGTRRHACVTRTPSTYAAQAESISRPMPHPSKHSCEGRRPTKVMLAFTDRLQTQKQRQLIS